MRCKKPMPCSSYAALINPQSCLPACRYTSRGFGLSYISHFTGMPTGDVVAHIVEGKTAKVSVVSVFLKAVVDLLSPGSQHRQAPPSSLRVVCNSPPGSLLRAGACG